MTKLKTRPGIGDGGPAGMEDEMKTLEEALGQPPAGKERYYADHGWGTDFIMDRQDGALSADIVAERLNGLTAENERLTAECRQQDLRIEELEEYIEGCKDTIDRLRYRLERGGAAGEK